jgi:hypothetical protein
MNKKNLITLGAIAQAKFNMKDNFQLMEVASDHFGKVRVAIPSSISNISNPFATPTEFDDVELIQFGTPNNYEFVWCGYSARANVLVIKEVA